MAPALDPALVGQEAAACALLGAVLGLLRAVFPAKGRGAFLPDLLLAGAVLLGVQSYAASLSAGGVLRWYQLAAAALSALGAEQLARPPLRGLFWLVSAPVRWTLRLLHPLLQRRKARQKRAKERRNAKRTAKKQKKNLPRPQRLLYNSNVSK